MYHYTLTPLVLLNFMPFGGKAVCGLAVTERSVRSSTRTRRNKLHASNNIIVTRLSWTWQIGNTSMDTGERSLMVTRQAKAERSICPHTHHTHTHIIRQSKQTTPTRVATVGMRQCKTRLSHISYHKVQRKSPHT